MMTKLPRMSNPCFDLWDELLQLDPGLGEERLEWGEESLQCRLPDRKRYA